MPKMDAGREAFATGLNWLTGTFRCLLTRDITINPATHRNLSQIPVGNRALTSNVLDGKEVLAAGWLKSNMAVFPNTEFSDPCDVLLIYYDTSDPETSTLIWYAEVSVYPAGDNIEIEWPEVGIFRL